MATGKITKGDKKRGKKIAGHMVWQNEDNSIEVSKEMVEKCGSVKAALRELATKAGFKFDPDWTVQQLGKNCWILPKESNLQTRWGTTPHLLTPKTLL